MARKNRDFSDVSRSAGVVMALRKAGIERRFRGTPKMEPLFHLGSMEKMATHIRRDT